MKIFALPLALAAGLVLNPNPASADILLIERIEAERHFDLPTRGSRMADIEARFGAPARKYPTIAGPSSYRYNPPITRWDYRDFNVYFEYDRLIDAVLNQTAFANSSSADVPN